VRADGAIFSFASFFQKVAKGVGGAAIGYALGLAGYVANAAQPETAIRMIHNLMTLVPIGIVMVMIVAAMLHTLDRRAHDQILAKLAEGN
jgi:GPH family glycoside/pentoside/hexuronide:cation symporter